MEELSDKDFQATIINASMRNYKHARKKKKLSKEMEGMKKKQMEILE